MKRTVKLSFYVMIFLIFALIGYWMPMVGDDLNWWSAWGLQYFQSGTFTHYDGRYFGDLLIILMMKFKSISFLAYGIFPTLIVYLTQKIREEISPAKGLGLVSAGITATIMLLAPKLIFKQIWGWHSGFANYVPSVVFPLFLIYLVIKNLDRDNRYYRTSTMLIFFAAMFAQFFAEHITLLNCFNIVLVWLFFRKRFGKSFQKVIYAIMAGNFLGAILMFINGAYLKVFAGTDPYRHLSGKQDTMYNYFQNYYRLPVIILAVIILLLFISVVVIVSLRLRNRRKQQLVNISLILFSIVSVAPFLVISPFGSRCLFAAFCFISVLIAINLDILLDKYHNFILPVVILATVSAGLRADYMSKDYGDTFALAINYSAFQTNANRDVYYIPSYKDIDYIWSGDTHDDAMFKSYYITHKENPVVAVSYADWTDALRITNKKSYKSQYFMMVEFDKQIQKKINLINEKYSKK